MSISIHGYYSWHKENSKEEENQFIEKKIDCSFKGEKGALVIKGGGLSPFFLKSLSREDREQNPFLDKKKINPLPLWKDLFKSLLKLDILKQPFVDPIRIQEMEDIPFWKDLLERLLKEKRSLLKENEKEQPLPSLLENSLDFCFTLFPEEKFFPFLLSRLFPPSVIKRYKELCLEKKTNKLVEEQYDKDRMIFFEEEGREKTSPSLIENGGDKNLNLDIPFKDLDINPEDNKKEEEKNKPPSLIETSFKKCFTQFSEEKLLTIFLSRQFQPSLMRKYVQLSLERQKNQFFQEIMKRGEMFHWERVKTALLSRFPSIFKNKKDLEYIVSPSLICFFKYFSPFSFNIKKDIVYLLLDDLIKFEEPILYDLFLLRFPIFFQSFNTLPSPCLIKNSLNILEKIQCTIWILKVYTKTQLFCYQTFKKSIKKKHIQENTDQNNFEIFVEKRMNFQKEYFLKKLELCFKIQKYLVQLKNSSIYFLTENFKSSYQELTGLANQLSQLTQYYRRSHECRIKNYCP